MAGYFTSLLRCFLQLVNISQLRGFGYGVSWLVLDAPFGFRFLH
jgi:hypothetical protein